jgi:hypothetical protein
VCFAAVVERQNVRMVEPRGELDLAKKALGPERRSQIGMKNF